jgi:hypothetical protein
MPVLINDHLPTVGVVVRLQELDAGRRLIIACGDVASGLFESRLVNATANEPLKGQYRIKASVHMRSLRLQGRSD